MTQPRENLMRHPTTLILTLVLLIAALTISLTPTAVYAQDSTTCEDRLATAKSIARQALVNAEDATAKAVEASKERDDAVEQRDAYRAQRDEARVERDVLTGRLASVNDLNLELLGENSNLMTANAQQQAVIESLRAQRWYWLVAGAAVVVAGGVAFKLID